MPRDLHSELTPLEREVLATRPVSPPYEEYPLTLTTQPSNKMKDLRPYCLLLNETDLDDCDWLEHAAFDPNEAASREKVRRLLVERLSLPYFVLAPQRRSRRALYPSP